MRIGIYVGSFNPVHLGHIKVINYLLDHNYVDKVLVIPTLNYWDKNNLIDIKDRINMLKFYETEKIIIDTTHNNYPYTYLLMRALTKEKPNEKLSLVLGSDNIIDFDKWKNYQELLNYHLIVVNRDNLDISSYIEKLGSDSITVINDFPYLPVSSTSIRNDINNPYLDDVVREYIKKNHLYK